MGHLDLPEDDLIAEINLTPLVDISLVLVIIFMVIAPFFSQILKPIRLPKAARADMTEAKAIKVSVYWDGTLTVGLFVVNESGFEAAIRRELDAGKAPWVILRAAEEVTHGRVMDIMKLVKKSGIQRVAFAIQPTTPDAGGEL